MEPAGSTNELVRPADPTQLASILCDN